MMSRIPSPAVVMVDQEDDLLAVALKGLLGCGGQLSFILQGNARGRAMVVLFFSARPCRRSLWFPMPLVTVDPSCWWLKADQSKSSRRTWKRGVGDERVEGLLIAGNALRIGIVAGLDLQDAGVLKGGAVSDRRAGGIEVELLCGREAGPKQGDCCQ